MILLFLLQSKFVLIVRYNWIYAAEINQAPKKSALSFAKSSTPAFVLGIGPMEEERIRQQKRDFTVVLARCGNVVGVIPK